jgi:hypothetical protein
MTWSLARVRWSVAAEVFSAAAGVRLQANPRTALDAVRETPLDATCEIRSSAQTSPKRGKVLGLPRAALLMMVFIVAFSLTSASCMRRHVRAFVPPPTRPRPPFVPPPMPQLPDPLELDAALEAPTPPESDSTFPVLPPPTPAPPRRAPVVATPRPLPPPPEPTEQVPSPRLGQIFTADQSRDYNRTLDESLTRVRLVLAAAAGRRLTADQDNLVVRIRTFVMQAEQAREQDLVTAVSLARRADLLAQDLAGRLPGAR